MRITFQSVLLIFAAGSVLVTGEVSAAEAGAVPLVAHQMFITHTSLGNLRCGKVSGKWIPGVKLNGGLFLSYHVHIINLKQAIAQETIPSRKNKLKKKLKDARNKNKVGLLKCHSGPPNGAPHPTPPPSSPNDPAIFDGNGNVTTYGKSVLQIPSNLSANISSGQSVFLSYCVGCHDERMHRTFPDYRQKISVAPMFYTSAALSDSSLAHLTAWLNRDRH